MDGNTFAMPGVMNPYMGAAGYVPGPGYPSPFVSQPMMFGGAPQVQVNNALTDEEINQIMNKPNTTIDINVSQDDYLRSMCTHKKHGVETVMQTLDDDNMVYCSICQETWDSTKATKEEVKAIVDKLISHIQNMKWVGSLPIELIREFCVIIPLLKKFPDLYEVAISNFNKFGSAKNYVDARDASVYSNLNNLMGSSMPGYYSNMIQTNPYQQTANPYMPQQQNPYMTTPTVAANPNINPMQAQVGQAVQINPYGQQAVNPYMPQQVYTPQINSTQQGVMGQQPQQTMNSYMPQPYVPSFNPVVQQPQQATTMNNPIQQGNEQVTANGTASKQETVSI